MSVSFKHWLLGGYLLGLVACEGELAEPVAADRLEALSVNASLLDLDTKALVEDEYLPSGGRIGVTLTGAGGGTYDGASYDNCPFHVTGTGSNQTWEATGQTIWLSSTLGRAYAYYPYVADVDIEAIPVTGESELDYMYATGKGVSVNAFNAKASFQMAHALSVIRLSIFKGEYGGDGAVVSTSLQGACFGLSATLNAKTGALRDIVGSDSERVMTAPDGTLLSTSTGFVQDYYVVPTGNSGAITLKLAVDDLSFQTTTEAVTILPGRVYEYKVSLQAASMAISGTSVTAWSYRENETEYETNIK